jgi:hypothetical protein
MDRDDGLMNSSSDSEKEDDSNNLFSIFKDPYATTYVTEDGKKRWRCEWCKKDFSLWNATKALYHLVQKKQVDIAPCRGRIDQESKQRYLELYTRKKQKGDNIQQKRELIQRSVDTNNV